jgi:DNA-binding MarR family transcriptional regulator
VFPSRVELRLPNEALKVVHRLGFLLFVKPSVDAANIHSSDAPLPERLRATQFSILAKLKQRGPLTINALAKDMVMDRTRLGRNIPLERDGLIRIEPIASDRRAKQLI